MWVPLIEESGNIVCCLVQLVAIMAMIASREKRPSPTTDLAWYMFVVAAWPTNFGVVNELRVDQVATVVVVVTGLQERVATHL